MHYITLHSLFMLHYITMVLCDLHYMYAMGLLFNSFHCTNDVFSDSGHQRQQFSPPGMALEAHLHNETWQTH